MVPWATRVLNPNGSSIGAAVFAGLTSVTNRQTHTTRSVTRGLIYVHSGQSNLTFDIAAAYGRFSRIRQVTPMRTPYTESQKNGGLGNVPYNLEIGYVFIG